MTVLSAVLDCAAYSGAVVTAHVILDEDDSVRSDVNLRDSAQVAITLISGCCVSFPTALSFRHISTVIVSSV